MSAIANSAWSLSIASARALHWGLVTMNKDNLESISTTDLDSVTGGLGRMQLLNRAAQGRWGSQGVVDVLQHTFTKKAAAGQWGAKGTVGINPLWGGDSFTKKFVGTVDTIGQHVHGLHAVP